MDKCFRSDGSCKPERFTINWHCGPRKLLAHRQWHLANIFDGMIITPPFKHRPRQDALTFCAKTRNEKERSSQTRIAVSTLICLLSPLHSLIFIKRHADVRCVFSCAAIEIFGQQKKKQKKQKKKRS